MAIYYVGSGGSDANSGLTWALRKLTLNGAEDVPVVAGDTVYVGPGVYREMLTVDVAGTSGNPITYIGDVTGENTDGVGGVIRVTGSDDDLTEIRSKVVEATIGLDFRTFRGFRLDMPSARTINVTSVDDWIIEDCSFSAPGGGNDVIYINGTCVNWIIRRCVFVGARSTRQHIRFTNASTMSGSHLVENCLFLGGITRVISIERIDTITIKNCTFIIGYDVIRIFTALAVSAQIDVNNCIFYNNNVALRATTLGEIVEDYNTFYVNLTDRTNVAVGANSQTYPPLFDQPILQDGVLMPWQIGALSEWSQVARIAGTGEPTDDLFGVTRPATSAKKSWGAIQLREGQRETTTKRTGTASLKLADAGDHAIRMPVDGTQITIDVWTYFETNYAGTKPQLIIRQPGQADDTTVATGAVDTWENLTTTLTPAAGWIDIIFRSNNTAVAGSFATYWDDLAAS